MITATMFGLLGWAISAADGPGKLLDAPATSHGSLLAWSAVYGFQSMLGMS